AEVGSDQINSLLNDISRTIRQVKNVEDLLYPVGDAITTWSSLFSNHPLSIQEDLQEFGHQVQRWLNSFYLPADQLLLIIGRDIFPDSANLSITYHLASFLRSLQDTGKPRTLRELTGELQAITENQRRYFDFEESAPSFEPRPGVVTVATLHASKGL